MKNTRILSVILFFSMVLLTPALWGQNKTANNTLGSGKKEIQAQMACVQSDRVVENVQAPVKAVSEDDSFEIITIPEAPSRSPMATITSTATGGSWGTGATWVGGNVPVAANDVVIAAGATVTVDAPATCATLSFTTVSANTTLTINSTNTLTVTGAVSMARPSAGFLCVVNINAGSATFGSLTMSATTSTRNDNIKLTTGALTVSGALTTGTTGCVFSFTGAGTFNMNGALTGTPVITLFNGSTLNIGSTGTPSITTVTGSNVNYTGASAQTIPAQTNLGNIGFSGAGTKTIAASTSVTVTGNLTNSSTLVLTLGTSTTGTYLYVKGNFINNVGATYNGTAAYTTLQFNGTTAQSFTNDGTVTAPMYTMALGNTAGLTLLGSNQVVCQRVNLYYGTVTNSNKITLGNGGSTYGVVQVGSSATYAAGAFDQAPTFSAGTGGYQLLYAPALNNYSTSYEVPADGNIAYFLLTCSPTILTLSRDISIPNVYTTGLNFSNGNLSIGAHTLTINGTTAVVTGTLTGGTSSNITFTGTPATSLPAVSGGLNNLLINNAAGITLGGAVTVNGTLTLSNGLLTNGANLTMATGSTISRLAGSLYAAPVFAGTVNLIYTGAPAISTGKELPTGTSVLNNLTLNDGGVTQYAYNTSTTNLLTDAFPNLTSWTGNSGTGAGLFNSNATANSGGTSPEVQFTGSGTHSAASTTYSIYRGPVITTGYTTLNISFKMMSTGYYIQNFPTYLKLQTATSASGPWTDVWSVPYTAIAAQTVSISNVTSNVGGNMYFQFAYVGDYYSTLYWYFDNLVIDGISNVPIACTATVNGTLDLTAGTYTIGSGNSLALNGTVAGSNTITGSNTSNLAIGGSGTNLTLPAITAGLNNLSLNRANGAILSNANTVNGVLALTSGILTTTAANQLSLVNTATTAITGGSATSFINGPVVWSLPASLASGSTYNFAVGKGSTYLPFALVNPTTSTGACTAQAEAFTGSTGGTYDATLASISSSEYWSLVTTGNFTNSSVSLTRPTAIAPLDAIGGQTVLTGSYSSLTGTAGTYGVSTSAGIGTNRYFVLATKNCVTPENPGDPASNSPQCINFGVTLTCSGTPPATETWYWQTTATGTSTVNSGTTFTVSTSGTYYIRSQDNSTLCWSTGAGSIAVIVTPLPTVSITGASSICIGNTTALSPISGGSWISNNTGIATVTDAGVVTAVAAGNATFTFTLTSTGCSNTTTTVTVNAIPAVSIAGSASICKGLTTTLLPASLGTWVSSNTGIATVTNAGLVSGVNAGAATFTYTLTSTGCSNTTAAVTVKPLPTATASSNTPVCSGSNLNLTGTTNIGTNYIWTGPNSFSSTSQNPIVSSITAAATGTYSFTASLNGCISATGTTSVTVNATPSAVTISPASATISAGTVQSLVASGGTLPGITILSENFNSGVGSFSIVASSSTAAQDWTARANGYVYSSSYTFSGSTGGFMLANSDVGGSSSATTNTQLVSPAFSTLGYYGMSLSFKEYLKNATDVAAAIEISNDNFATTTVLRNDIINVIGTISTFATTSLAIPIAFENKASVKIRFRYAGSFDWFWAVDEITITGTASNPTTWSPATGLYTNNSATIPYVANTVASSVWAKPATNQTYTATATSAAGCTSSASGSITVSSSSWIGGISTDWNNALNWGNGIPLASTDADIPGTAVFMPIVTSLLTSPAVCNNLTINPGATFTVATSKALTVSGTLTNSSGNTGLVINSGGSLIQNTAGVNATVNRSVADASDINWHYFISPITSSIQASASSCFNGAYLDRYEESTGAWVRLLTNQDVLPETGYSLNYLAGTHTLDFPGILQSSPVAFSNLSYTGVATGDYGAGWHLVGNPYPCGINPALCSLPTNMNAFAYVWDGVQYKTPSIGNSDIPGTIASLQGFFVRTTSGTNSLTLANVAKIHGGTFYKSNTTDSRILSISIEGNNYSDKMYVRFNPDATANFDQAFDAYKRLGIDAAPQLYSILPDVKAAVNTLPDYTTNPNVPLGLKVGAATTYNLTVDGISSFDQQLPIRLDDLKLGTSQDLRAFPTYSFTASPGDAENRFRLRFASALGIDEPNSTGLNIYTSPGLIHITLESPASGTAYLYSVSGQLLATAALNPGETLLRYKAQGVYLVKVISGKTFCTQKVVVTQ